MRETLIKYIEKSGFPYTPVQFETLLTALKIFRFSGCVCLHCLSRMAGISKATVYRLDTMFSERNITESLGNPLTFRQSFLDELERLENETLKGKEVKEKKNPTKRKVQPKKDQK
jgi:hypothetical protein